MQKILRSPASMRRKVVNKTFGVPLKDLCRVGPSGYKVPILLQKIIDFIQMHGIGHEGIFRINGSSKVVDKLKLHFDRHGDANLEEASDVMAVASLLKLFFRELPDSLITQQLHAQFLAVQEEFQYNKEESLKQLKNLLQQLPEENFMVLRFLCRFLLKVTQYEDTNKMNSMALAIVFGPNLFRCADGIQGLREQGQTNHLVRLFIDKFEFLFGPDNGGSSPPQVGVNGSGSITWSSKRIEVQAAREKKSPPVIPAPTYEQHLRSKRNKQVSQDEVDLNSNYSDLSRDDTSSSSPQNQSYLSTVDADFAEDRALSPFTLDSEVGTSAAPSPVSSSHTSELVEKTIQDCISQHLFGSHWSPERGISPRSQEAPVAMPRRKHQKKVQEGSSFNRRSNSESSLERLVSSFDSQDPSVRAKVLQFTDDTMVMGSHDHIRRKGRPSSKAYDFTHSQGLIIGQKLASSSLHDGRSREDTSTDVTREETSELDSVKRNSGTLHSLTAGRAAPPKRRSPTKKNFQPSSDDQNQEIFANGQERSSRRINDAESRSPGRDVWLRQNGEGQRSAKSRNVREGGLWGVQTSASSLEGPVPQPRQRRKKTRECEQEAEEEVGRRRRQGDRAAMPYRGTTTGGEENGGVERRTAGGEQRLAGMERGIGGEDRGSSPLRGQMVPPLDLTCLHVNTDGHNALQAWHGHQSGGKEGGGGGGGANEGGSQTLSRLEKLQTITSLLHDPYDAPLSPRAKDAPPTFGSSALEMEGPPSPVSKHDFFPRSSKRSENALDEEDSVAAIKQLTRQVRSLKQKIKQYEEEFERQYNAKPTQNEKLGQPEIKKMIGELKRATKQLKALKSEVREAKNPLHSTLPARLSGNEMNEEGDSSPVHLAGLKESLNLAQKRLQEKRIEANRSFDIHELTQDEIKEEKVAIQKALLQLESKYGRPTTKASKEIMKPLYDRYRTLKKILKKQDARRSVQEEATPSDLNTIEEHIETKDFMPKQMGPVHAKYDEGEEEDIFGTAEFRVTQMISPSGQRLMGRSPSDLDDICPSPNDSGRVDSPYSPSSAFFHEASLEELLARQDQAQSEKRRLRRVLKDFEDNFLQETGQRVQKEDRSPMEMEYNDYKHIKKQLKLLNALIQKHQSQTSAAVT
ncbi:protein FAM13A-like [Diadema antillarum]|uniref:protein FAM13A-like n=1 Tax=Diadema antillarum TaxID=105358 RepID=UPI003A88454A